MVLTSRPKLRRYPVGVNKACSRLIPCIINNDLRLLKEGCLYCLGMKSIYERKRLAERPFVHGLFDLLEILHNMQRTSADK